MNQKKKNENSDHQGLLQSSPKVTSLSDLTSVLLCDKQQPPHDESEVEGWSVSEWEWG